MTTAAHLNSVLTHHVNHVKHTLFKLIRTKTNAFTKYLYCMTKDLFQYVHEMLHLPHIICIPRKNLIFC